MAGRSTQQEPLSLCSVLKQLRQRVDSVPAELHSGTVFLPMGVLACMLFASMRDRGRVIAVLPQSLLEWISGVRIALSLRAMASPYYARLTQSPEISKAAGTNAASPCSVADSGSTGTRRGLLTATGAASVGCQEIQDVVGLECGGPPATTLQPRTP